MTRLKKHFSVGAGWGRPRALKAVDDVSFEVGEGEAFGIVGESGSGKSTLAMSIVRLYEPTDGAIRFLGRDIAHLSQRELRPLRRGVQMIFQDTKASLNPRLRVRDCVAEPLITHGVAPRERQARLVRLMELVGLGPEYLDRFPHELSGGQRQRVGIARALAIEPKLIIADEPVSALDVSIQAQILNLLKTLQRDLKLTFILISHELGVVSYFCDRVAVMYLGRIVEMGPTESVLSSPRHPYTRALVNAIPNPDPRARRQPVPLRGEIPSPLDPPPGCPFHTRCPVKIGPICETEEPSPRPVHGTGWAACHLLDDASRPSELPDLARSADSSF